MNSKGDGEILSLQVILLLVLVIGISVYLFFLFNSLNNLNYIYDEMDFENNFLAIHMLSSQNDGFFVLDYNRKSNYSFNNEYFTKRSAAITNRPLFFNSKINNFDFSMDNIKLLFKSQKILNFNSDECQRDFFPQNVKLLFDFDDSDWSKQFMDNIKKLFENKDIIIDESSNFKINFIFSDNNEVKINSNTNKYFCDIYTVKEQNYNIVFNLKNNDDSSYA